MHSQQRMPGRTKVAVTQFLTQLEASWSWRRCPPLVVTVRRCPSVSLADHTQGVQSATVPPPLEPHEAMLSTAEVAVILGVTPTTVLRYVRSKRLAAYKISRRLIRFKRTDVDAFIAAQEEERGRR